MKPCKICNEPQSSGYILCKECAEIVDGIPAERLREICQAERDGRCVVTDEESVVSAVRRAILVNSDEKKYRYELGKDCLIPCCKDAFKYLRQNAAKSALEQEERK